MKAPPYSTFALIRALAGPIVWAAHFFLLYLTEAIACTDQRLTAGTIRAMGVLVTVAALALSLGLLLLARARPEASAFAAETQQHFAFATPLLLLSMIAIIWTSMPLLLVPACVPAA